MTECIVQSGRVAVSDGCPLCGDGPCAHWLTPKQVEQVNGVLDRLKCRFGCTDPVVGLFYIPEGCWCWSDPIQALCAQHAIKVESPGPITCMFERLR